MDMIADYLDTGRTDEEIAAIVGCSISEVKEEREEWERLTEDYDGEE